MGAKICLDSLVLLVTNIALLFFTVFIVARSNQLEGNSGGRTRIICDSSWPPWHRKIALNVVTSQVALITGQRESRSLYNPHELGTSP